jgi:16S rRNA (guanine527-N7)-methyltransferase
LSKPMERRSVDTLRAFERLLVERGVPAGFVSQGDAGRIWDRHILDSVRALDCLTAQDRTVADLGSGAGLPGIPLAIARPNVSMILVERHQRRVAFLEAAVLDLGLTNVHVIPGAIEDVELRVDVCTARALADPVRAWQLAAPCLGEQGRLVYFAGRTWEEPPSSDDVSRSERRPTDAKFEICVPGKFPWQGPLVIMRHSL